MFFSCVAYKLLQTRAEDIRKPLYLITNQHRPACKFYHLRRRGIDRATPFFPCAVYFNVSLDRTRTALVRPPKGGRWVNVINHMQMI